MERNRNQTTQHAERSEREERERWAFRVGLAVGLLLVAFVAAGVVGVLAPCFR